MQCPLKRLESAIIAAEPGTMMIGEKIKSAMHDKACDPDCAWHMDGKCAVAVLAESKV
jgi:hypothetical protein